MKKLLAIVLGVVLCLGVVLMTGCGAFDGNYKEVKAEDLATVVEKVKEAKSGRTFDFEKYGYEIKGESKMETTYEGSKTEVYGKAEMKTAIVDNKGEATSKVESNTKADGKELKIKVEGYVKAGTLYTNSEIEGEKAKIKVPGKTVMNLIMELQILETLFPSLNPDLISTLEMYKGMEGIKFYLDDTDKDYVKVKIVAESKTQEGTGKFENVFLFDKNSYDLRGYKLVMNADGQEGGAKVKGDVKFEAAPYNGGLSFPGDLDSYIGL